MNDLRLRSDGDLRAPIDVEALAEELGLPAAVIEALVAEARATSERTGGPIEAILDGLLAEHRGPAPGRITGTMREAMPPSLPGPGKMSLTAMTPPAPVLAKRESSAARAVPAKRIDETVRHSSGYALPDGLREQAEALLGEDLSEVLIHDDELADETAAAIGARAFTLGAHIFFRRGQFSPQTAFGRELLLHELAHAAQWIRGDVSAGAALEVSRESDPLEVEADRLASTLASAFLPVKSVPGRPAGGRKSAAPIVTESSMVLRDVEEGADAVCIGAPTEVPEGGEDINRPGRVFWSGEPKLRLRGSDSTEADNVVGELDFNEKVQVIKRFAGDWYFVAREDGTMGYAYSVHIRTDLPEPNAQLHLVEGGTSAIGIAEQYYEQWADDWGQDLRFYVNVLAWANGIDVPDTTSGWREVHFQAGDKIWIPSHDFARSLKGVVNSGSYTYNFADAIGVADVIERIGELWDDFAQAIELAGQYIPEALARHSIEGLERALEALVHMLLIAGFIMILSTLLGAAIGALVGGAGAAPGAAIGFKVGLAVLKWMGLAFLVVWIADALVQVGSAFGSFLGMVWDARGDEDVLDAAAMQLAEALGLLVGKLIEGLVMLAAARGIGWVMGRIGNTKFGQSLGGRFREWLGERVGGRQGESTGRGQQREGETTGRQREGETTSTGPTRFNNRSANELIESSQGRPGNDGTSVGHPLDHVPPEGATAVQVALQSKLRPNKQNTTVYRSRRHAVQDLRDALNSQSEAIGQLQPGGEGLNFRFNLSRPRQGYNAEFGMRPTEVSFREVSIYIERAPDGSLTIIQFTPRLQGL